MYIEMRMRFIIYAVPYIVRVIKSRRILWAGYGGDKNAY
jgi:hypothetical protein